MAPLKAKLGCSWKPCQKLKSLWSPINTTHKKFKNMFKNGPEKHGIVWMINIIGVETCLGPLTKRKEGREKKKKRLPQKSPQVQAAPSSHHHKKPPWGHLYTGASGMGAEPAHKQTKNPEAVLQKNKEAFFAVFSRRLLLCNLLRPLKQHYFSWFLLEIIILRR